MSRRPLIAISTNRTFADNGPLRSYPMNYVGDDYPQAVLKAGGTPVLLALHDPALYPDVAAQQLEHADGLVLTGGPDVSPLTYGEQPHARLGNTLPDRDRFELALIAEARRRDLPVLAICRGIQILNVAYGGTLYQDLPSQLPDAIQHTQASVRQQVSHHVAVAEGSRLAGLVGGPGTIGVTSFHHQAIRDLGEGLTVVATAPDGVIEAVEADDQAWVVGLQWHPEMSHPADAASMDVFRGFVARCQPAA
ncbi:MAG TPA: gamma-glutamyl-gamma-aminobutyrate hydrolase family protein [Propionibacteriaceae bacterium]|nr:gamma-glutamyl-gamma-aminobutyrate hydrolase family protein [Propionibacteriaceae bacterium]